MMRAQLLSGLHRQHGVTNKSHREQLVETRLRPNPVRQSRLMLLGALQRLRVVSKNIDQEAHAAATSPHNLRPQPTEGQREAGNYKMGHKSLIGLDLTIENPAGSYRRMEWPIMQAHYGYVKRSLGADGDHVDVFVQRGTPDDWAGTVYVIDQIDESSEFDEVKAMIGFSDQRSAERCYLSHYPPGWRLGPVTAVSPAEFAEWARSDAAQFSFAQWPNASMTPGADDGGDPQPAVAPWARRLASMTNASMTPGATTTAERAEALLERAEALGPVSVSGAIAKVMGFPPARLCEFELAREAMFFESTRRANLGPDGLAPVRKAFNEDQPRDDHGRFTSAGDETGHSAPEPGERFVVYRLGDASVDLTNRNAGNAHAVARHIARSQSAEGPVGVGGVGDTVHAFEVSVGAKFGGFARFNAGNAAEKTGSVVGRDVERGNQVIYSFARGAAYTARPLGSAKLTDLNTTLKEKHDAWDFDDAGTNLGARVLREHFKPVGKVFNEDQPRDERGRWGSGGAQDGAQGSMKYYELSPAERAVYAQGIKSVADDVAKQFGYPADKIEATIGPSKFFELNGKTYSTAGEAWLESGRIQLYPAALSNVKAVEEVIAHEVGHQLLERVFKAQEAERARMMLDPETLAVAFVRNGENVIGPGIRPDGSLRTDALKERYPLYTAQWAVQDSPGTWTKLQKEDGVTEYSRDWWAAYEDGKATSKQARHETYAEINMLAFVGKRDGKTLTELGVKPAWRKLYANYSKAARGLS